MLPLVLPGSRGGARVGWYRSAIEKWADSRATARRTGRSYSSTRGAALASCTWPASTRSATGAGSATWPWSPTTETARPSGPARAAAPHARALLRPARRAGDDQAPGGLDRH